MGATESHPDLAAATPDKLPLAALKQAAAIASVSPETVRRWAIKYGIGKQIDPGATWRISIPGLLMVIACDSEALDAFSSGALDSPLVTGYIIAARDGREFSR